MADLAVVERKAWVLVVVLAAALTGQAMLVMSSIPYWMTDFFVYLGAGDAVVNGLRLYEIGIDTPAFPDMLFIYTPFAAALLAPLSLLSTGAAQFVWTFLTLLALGAALWLSLRMAGVTARQRLGLLVVVGLLVATLLSPVQFNLLLGQINVFLMLLVLIDFAPGLSPRWRGIATGVAAGIKLTPLIFVAYLFFTGRKRAAVQAMGAFVVTALIGFAVVPSDSRSYWFDGIFFDSTRMVPGDMLVNHSLPALFARLSGGGAPPSWSFVVSAVVALACLGLAVHAWRRGHDMVGLLVVAFTAQLVSPITWMHHGVWVVPALVWLALAKWRGDTVLPRVLLAAAVVWYLVPLWILGQQVVDGVPVQLTPGGNLLVTLTGNLAPAVVAIALLPVWLRRLRPPVAVGEAPVRERVERAEEVSR